MNRDLGLALRRDIRSSAPGRTRRDSRDRRRRGGGGDGSGSGDDGTNGPRHTDRQTCNEFAVRPVRRPCIGRAGKSKRRAAKFPGLGFEWRGYVHPELCSVLTGIQR